MSKWAMVLTFVEVAEHHLVGIFWQTFFLSVIDSCTVSPAVKFLLIFAFPAGKMCASLVCMSLMAVREPLFHSVKMWFWCFYLSCRCLYIFDNNFRQERSFSSIIKMFESYFLLSRFATVWFYLSSELLTRVSDKSRYSCLNVKSS